MQQKVIKRDGQIVKFDSAKITNAICKASNVTKEIDELNARKLTKNVIKIVNDFVKEKQSNMSIPTVEEIQDIVEKVLLSSKYKQTAKSYILYREQHKKMRDFIKNASINMIDDYLEQLDWQVNENSNMGYSIQGLNNYLASAMSKNYWLNKIYSSEIKEAHENGDIHIHDLNIISVYCVGWDLKDLLSEGFTGVEGKVASKPAKHFKTALGQIVNFLYTMQGESAGAQAFSNFDTLLAPFIRYDKLNYKQVKQALQEFVFNMNIPTRVGFQTPFSNITMDLKVPSYYKEQCVIIGGEMKEETYGEFQQEMNMINKAFFEVMMEGDASGTVRINVDGKLGEEDALYIFNEQLNGEKMTDFASELKEITIPQASHKWDAGTVTKKATTAAKGEKTYTCTICKATKKEDIPKLAKKANPLKVKGKTATVKYSKLKKKTQTLAVTKVIKFTKKLNDKKTYTLVSAKKGSKSFKKYFKINKTTGKATMKKGLKKGTYKVKVKVKAAGNANYMPSSVKTVTFKVKVEK